MASTISGARGASGSEPLREVVQINPTPDVVRKLLSLINPDCPEREWFRVLCDAKNIISDDKIAADLAEEWASSALVPGRYDVRTFLRTWYTWAERSVGEERSSLNALIARARSDQPEAYDTMRVRICEEDPYGYTATQVKLKALYMHVKGACPHGFIADVASGLVGTEKYVFAGPSTKDWYVYMNGTWRSDFSALYLREKVKRHVRVKILEERARQEAIARALGDAERQAEYRKKRVASLWYIANLLMSTRSLDGVVSEMRHRHLQPDFRNLLNSKRGIMPFTDGAYDFNRHLFRPYRADDYVTETVGYAYSDMMCADTSEVVGVLTRMTADNPEKLQMLRVIMANACDGFNSRESLDLWVGYLGANGKTTALDIIRAAFGPLSISLSGDALSKDAELCPQVARFQGVRFAVISEPNWKLGFNAELVKKLTGNDVISVRTLFKRPCEFRASANVVVVCNTLPKLTLVDNAIRRRIKVLEFNQCFKAVPDPERPNEQLADDDLKQRIDANPMKFGMGLMRWAMELRTSDKWNRAKMVVPLCARIATDDYLDAADPYTLTTARYIVSANNAEYVLVGDMYDEYIANGGRSTLTAFGRSIGVHFNRTGATKVRREGKTAWLGVRLRRADDPEPEPEPAAE